MISELGLGLTLELRFTDVDRQNRRQTLAYIIARQSKIGSLQSAALRRVGVNGPRQRRLEAREVRPTFVGVDAVDEGVDVFVVAVVVLEGELDVDAVALRIDVHDVLVQHLLLLV